MNIYKQYTWSAVVKKPSPYFPDENLYDVYEWNIHKLKWVRLTSAQFGNEIYANDAALTISSNIQKMFDTNKEPPPPLE
jgi:hypothetical protein